MCAFLHKLLRKAGFGHAGAGKSTAILTILNNAIYRKLYRNKIEKLGCRVLEAGTIQEGRELLEKENPDLLLLDSEMPDGSGFDFCRELRQKSEIPILFVSDDTSIEAIREGYEAGCDDYLPLSNCFEVLKARICYLLGRSPEERGQHALPLKEYTILLIEDDLLKQDIVSNMISLLSYRVIACGAVAQAREAMARETPDLILLDAGLPNGSGIDFCRELASTKEIDTQLVLHTVPHDLPGKFECYHAGGEGFLSDPITLETLSFELRSRLP